MLLLLFTTIVVVATALVGEVAVVLVAVAAAAVVVVVDAAAAAVAAATADSSRFLSLLRTKRTVRNFEPLLPTIFKLSLSVPMQLNRALVCSIVPAAGAFG